MLDFYTERIESHVMKVSGFLVISLALHIWLFWPENLNDLKQVESLIDTRLHVETPEAEKTKKSSRNRRQIKRAKNSQKAAARQSPTAYKENLVSIIQSKAKFPKAALNLGHKGTVVVAISINKRGAIIENTIVRPSEYSSLNAAALELVRGLKYYKPLPKDFHPEKTFEIPIHYL